MPRTTTAHRSASTNKRKQAIAYLNQNRLAEAGKLLTELCRQNPMDDDAHYMLGMLNGRTGNFAAAANCFQQALTAKPESAQIHFGLGCALNSLGKPLEAAASLRHALTIKPKFVDALVELGNILYHQGQFPEAVDVYRKLLRKQPGNLLAQHRLGSLSYIQGDYQQAIKHYQQALRNNSREPKLHNDLARALSSLGKQQEALASHDRALRIEPDNPDAIAGKSLIFEWNSEFQKAHELLTPLINRGVENTGIALAYARICKRFDSCTLATRYMKTMLTRPSLSPGDRQQLEYALGKLLDSLGDYDKAFIHYRQGNLLKQPPYDPGQHASFMTELATGCTPELLERLPHAFAPSEQPVFIFGMPRSGTSLVEQILSSHPSVFGAGELPDIARMAMELANRPGSGGYPGCLAQITQHEVDQMAREYGGRLAGLAPDAARVTDKMPHNFLHLGLISLLFPEARVIHCVRDPMDTCASIYFQNLSSSHPYATDLANLGQYYRMYDQLMQHWKETLDIPTIEISYEQLVIDQERITRKLLDFCGLPWEPRCLSFYKNRRFVGTASYDQVREPLYTKSVGRWHNYQRHLEPLKAALGDLAN